ILNAVDLKPNGRALVDDGPTLDDHLVSITHRLDGPQLGHADFPLRPNRRPLIPLSQADRVALFLIRKLLLHGLIGHATVDEFFFGFTVNRLKKRHRHRLLRWTALRRPSRW